MKKSPVVPLAWALVLTAALAAPAAGDLVFLKNGEILRGEVTDLRPEESFYLVSIGDRGSVRVPVDSVVQVKEEAPRDQREGPDEEAPSVRITLKKRGNEAGGSIEGRLVSGPGDDRFLTLELAEGGTLRIPREDVARREDLDRAAKEKLPEGADRQIATTHRVKLYNGRTLRGDVIPSADESLVRIRLGSLGVMSIERRRVAVVEEVGGEVILPEPTVSRPVPAVRRERQVPVQEPDPAELARRAALRERLAAGEKIDRVLEDEIVAVLGNRAIREAGILRVPDDLDPTLADEIRGHAYELTRQRTPNRVRAENHLKRIGGDAIPFLVDAAHHPFELTRRAVQRIIRETGDLRGVPLAVEALDDDDRWVRVLAKESLETILGGEIDFDPDASERRRWGKSQHFMEIWQETQREALLRLLDFDGEKAAPANV